MNYKITDKERVVLNEIKSFFKKNGYAPTRKEIREMCNLKDDQLADYYVRNLIKKRRIKKLKKKEWRNLIVLPV